MRARHQAAITLMRRKLSVASDATPIITEQAAGNACRVRGCGMIGIIRSDARAKTKQALLKYVLEFRIDALKRSIAAGARNAIT